MTPLQYNRRDRLAKWLFMQFLKGEGPTGWDDLLQRQRNYWRKQADEALIFMAGK